MPGAANWSKWHMWATWHVMAGTSLGELQELGAWKSEMMVKRYAHFAPEQLRRAADRLATFWWTETNRSQQKRRNLFKCW